jgi:hypothetical protein
LALQFNLTRPKIAVKLIVLLLIRSVTNKTGWRINVKKSVAN